MLHESHISMQGGLLLPSGRDGMGAAAAQPKSSAAAARSTAAVVPLQLQSHTTEAPEAGALIAADSRRCSVAAPLVVSMSTPSFPHLTDVCLMTGDWQTRRWLTVIPPARIALRFISLCWK